MTPEDIQKELWTVSNGFDIYLFVAFGEDSSIPIALYRGDVELSPREYLTGPNPDFLPVLREAIALGGIPIGWVRLIKNVPEDGSAVEEIVELGSLQDMREEKYVYDYLLEFVDAGRKKNFTDSKFRMVQPDGSVLDLPKL